MQSIKVVAFDLDDTLIRLGPDFISTYISMLDTTLREKFPSQGSLVKEIYTSMEEMMAKGPDEERLEDFFYRRFESRTGLRRDQIESLLQGLYVDQFPALARLTWPIYGVMGLLTTIKERGYQVALLTSPLFPRVAIDARLEWAGLEGFPFDLRTSLETVHTTKPQPDYYAEAADQLGISPEHWLMVGNDLVEDIVPAHAAGMAVYWVQEALVELSGDVKIPSGTMRGSVHHVLDYLQ